MKNTFTNLPVLGLLLLAVFGCNMMPGAKTNYLEGDAAQTAAAAVKSKVGKSFKIAQVIITNKEFIIQVQDPNNLRNLNEYRHVGGILLGPHPVQLNAMNDNLEQSVFPFDEINFAAVPTLAREAVAKAEIEGGLVSEMLFQRGFALTNSGAGALGTPRWLIQIDGTREKVTATADAQGKLIGVNLSNTSRAVDYSVFKNGELQKAQDAFKNKLGADVVAETVTIYDKYVVITAPLVENMQKTSKYKFDLNGLSKNEFAPGQRNRSPNIENFKLADVNLADAGKYVEKAKNRLNLPQAEFDFIYISRQKWPPRDTEFTTIWKVHFKSGAKDAAVEYDNRTGAEIRVSKD